MQTANANLEERITTIVSIEEQRRGWLAVISRSRRLEQEIVAYRQLHALFSFFGNIPVEDWTQVG
jgi:hypothetical protein